MQEILPGCLDNDHTVLQSPLYGLVPPREGLEIGAQAQRYPEHTIPRSPFGITVMDDPPYAFDKL
jgi:hypothetical protein